PQSPCAMRARYFSNCIYRGRSNPNDFRILAIVAASAFCPAMARAGSGVKLKRAKVTQTVPKSVTIAHSRRLIKNGMKLMLGSTLGRREPDSLVAGGPHGMKLKSVDVRLVQ